MSDKAGIIAWIEQRIVDSMEESLRIEAQEKRSEREDFRIGHANGMAHKIYDQLFGASPVSTEERLPTEADSLLGFLPAWKPEADKWVLCKYDFVNPEYHSHWMPVSANLKRPPAPGEEG